MLEEVLKLIVFQQSSLDKDVEDLIISIKENIEKSDQLNNSDLTPLDKFQTELELKLSIDSSLKKLQIKFSSLKLKQFHRICNVILSKTKRNLFSCSLIDRYSFKVFVSVIAEVNLNLGNDGGFVVLLPKSNTFNSSVSLM